jgi:hypothetical protein
MLDLEKYKAIEFTYNGRVIDIRPLYVRKEVTLSGLSGQWLDGYDFERYNIVLPAEFSATHETWVSDILMEQAYCFMGESDDTEYRNDWDEDGKHILAWRLLETEPKEWSYNQTEGKE